MAPELDPDAAQLPYSAHRRGRVAVYGVALIVYGNLRARAVDDAIAHGEYSLPTDRLLTGLTVTGAVLGLATAAVIVFA